MTVITALTAQNTIGVQSIEGVSTNMVKAQITSILSDIGVDAIKSGMLYSEETIEAVVATLEQFYSIQSHPPIVIDPVCVSTSGHTLLPISAVNTLKERWFPWATILTPNVPEAELLAGLPEGSITSVEGMRQSARILSHFGCQWILIKGGHLQDSNKVVIDLLWDSIGETETIYERPRIDTKNTHGTGCTLSAAIAVELAKGKSGS